MEREDTTNAEQQADDQSVDEFKDEVENDPATASPPEEDGYERIRGG